MRILDLRLTRFENRALLGRLRKFVPDVVGFTGYNHESSIVKELARLVRETLPRARIVVGGHHATVAPDDFDIEDFAWRLAEALEARGVRKRYFAWTRSTTVNRSPELLRKWREIGLDSAFLGFEFPTNAELKAARKGGIVAGNEQALDKLRAMGVAVHAAFMVRPEYTEEQLQNLKDDVQSLPPAQCRFTVCTPSPGTPDYESM